MKRNGKIFTKSLFVGIALSCLLLSGLAFAEDGVVTQDLGGDKELVTETITALDGSVTVTETTSLKGAVVSQVSTVTTVEFQKKDDGTVIEIKTITQRTYTPTLDGESTWMEEVVRNITKTTSPGKDSVVEEKTLPTTTEVIPEFIENVVIHSPDYSPEYSPEVGTLKPLGSLNKVSLEDIQSDSAPASQD